MGRTWLLYLNYYVLQWFFFRLTRILNYNNIQIGWAVIFCLPLTGWNSKRYIPENPIIMKLSGDWPNEFVP